MRKTVRKADHDLLMAACAGDEKSLLVALAAGADPLDAYSSTGATALAMAALYGCDGCVKLLIPVSDAKAHDSYALRLAALHGQEECVRLLLPASDPLALNSQALVAAVKSGNAECVRMLLPVSDALAKGDDGNDAAQVARDLGQFEMAAMIEAFAQKQQLALEAAGALASLRRSL